MAKASATHFGYQRCATDPGRGGATWPTHRDKTRELWDSIPGAGVWEPEYSWKDGPFAGQVLIKVRFTTSESVALDDPCVIENYTPERHQETPSIADPVNWYGPDAYDATPPYREESTS